MYNYSLFHVIFALASMYMAMVLTGWNTLNASSSGGYAIDLSIPSVWVKIAASWVILLLYLWSLIAPYCCRDRQFG